MIRFWNAFTKLTGWPVQFVCFRTKVVCEDKAAQGRRIRGPAIVVSNHTSVYDYAVLLFVFFSRTLRCQMAEALFRKKGLGTFLRLMGGIYIDRTGRDFGFLAESEAILARGGVVCVFPESRLPAAGEPTPLEFKPSAAYLALSTGAPVIPVYTNGSYFRRARARVAVGAPMDARRLARPELTQKENIALVTRAMRERVVELEKNLHEKTAR